VGLRFRGKSISLSAHWIATTSKKIFVLMAVLARPAGNFALTLPTSALPVTRDLVLPGTKKVDRLNDLAEIMFVLRGESWSCTGMTIHALSMGDDAVSADITLELAREPGGAVEQARLRLVDEPIVTGDSSDAPPAVEQRPDTFDLREGLGRMRWTDDRDTLERNVYYSTWRKAGRGKTPDGGTTTWSAGLEIPGFLGIDRGDGQDYVWFSAFVSFGADGRVEGLTLRPWEHPHLAADMAAWLCERLGVCRSGDSVQRWNDGSVAVELKQDAPDRLLVVLQRRRRPRQKVRRR
jgi:hypothetical protein